MGKENEWEEDMKQVWVELIVDEAGLWTYGDSLHLSFFLCLFENFRNIKLKITDVNTMLNPKKSIKW